MHPNRRRPCEGLIAAWALLCGACGQAATPEPDCESATRVVFRDGTVEQTRTAVTCDDGSCRNCCLTCHLPSGHCEESCSDCPDECLMPAVVIPPRGQRAAGEECGTGWVECSAGLVCRPTDPASLSTRLCAGPAADGEWCLAPQGDEACADGLLCIPLSAQGVDGMCTRMKTEGERCQVDAECGGALHCYAGRSEATCKADGFDGWACDAEQDCAAGHVCVDADEGDDAPGTCGLPAAEEGPCYEDADCAENLRCGPQHMCRPLGARGYSCARDEDCAPGLVCNDANYPNTCAEPGRTGSPCLWDDDCAQGFYCSSDALPATCQERGLAGARCDSAAECAEGLICGVGHRCKLPD